MNYFPVFFRHLFFWFCLITVSISGTAQDLLLTAPSGGEQWPAYSVQKITWSYLNVDKVKIEASVDSGKTWQLLAENVAASAGFFNWEIPLYPSEKCFVRISDQSNPSIVNSNYPNQPFRIPAPEINLKEQPYDVMSGSNLPVQWQSGGVRFVNILLSTNNQQSYQLLASQVPAGLGFYNIRLPYLSGTQCFLKLADAETNFTSVTSVPFPIHPLPSISPEKYRGGNFDGHASISNLVGVKLLQPKQNDTLDANMIYTIQWKAAGVEKVELAFSADNRKTWTVLVSQMDAQGSYIWNVPDVSTDSGFIRVRDYPAGEFVSQNPGAFVIRKKQLSLESTLKQPVSTYRSIPFPISWEQKGLKAVSIKILETGAVIASGLPGNQQLFNWVIPLNTPSNFRISIQDSAGTGGIADTSAMIQLNDLPISTAGKYQGGAFDGHAANSNRDPIVSLISPKGNEEFFAGQVITLKFRTRKVEQLKLFYSLNNGLTWLQSESLLDPATGEAAWQAPAVLSNECRLALVSVDDNSLADTSGVFRLIAPQIVNLTDEFDWYEGVPKEIKWQAAGVNQLEISYKTSTNSSWEMLANGYPAIAGLLNWVVPGGTDSLWLRIRDVNNLAATIITTFHKKVKPLASITAAKFKGGSNDGHAMRSNINRIAIRRPSANESLSSGSVYPIAWQNVNISDTVMLQYSTDSGKTWITVANVPASNGQFAWQVPNPSSNTPGFAKSAGVAPLSGVRYDKCVLRAVDYLGDGKMIGASPLFTISTAAVGMISVKEGNWDDPQVWEGGQVPGPGAEVRVAHRVTVRVAGSCSKLEILPGGELRIGPGIDFRIGQ